MLYFEVEHIWNWFLKVFDPGGAGMGPSLPSYLEIEAYARAQGIVIHGWEAEAIRSIAAEYIRIDIRKMNSKNGQSVNGKTFKPAANVQDLKAMFKGAGTKNRSVVKKPPEKPKPIVA